MKLAPGYHQAHHYEWNPHMLTDFESETLDAAHICACGDMGRTVALLCRLLHEDLMLIDDWTRVVREQSEDVAWLLAHWAGELGLTEHGTSASTTWLTEEGRRALTQLRAFKEKAPE